MKIMLACSSCFWGFDHDRHGLGDGGMSNVEAEDTIKARAEHMTVGIKRYTFNVARAERAVSG